MKLEHWKERARGMKTELYVLYLAARHPQTPWYAKLVIAGCVTYAVTPVDLVPDFIPVLGLVDDLIFVALAIALAVRFVPAPVLAECRGRAQERVAMQGRFSWVPLVLVWLTLAAVGVALYL